jgi:hypothetical protein
MDTERWYIAVLVVASRVDGASAEPLLDLQLRLIRAVDDEQAYERAVEVGSQATHSYRNADGAVVSWQCLGLNDLRELGEQELVHGVEVFSQLTRRPATELLVAKEQLICFWAEANKDRTAREILGEST